MLNLLLTGVGGQGTVLAAKVLAQAAEEKGWHVRTAETIGMAQRGGNVVSHVRMGDEGEPVFAPLIALGTADLVVGFEPAEAARALPYLKRGGTLVTATSAIQPVSSALSNAAYVSADVLDGLKRAVEEAGGTFIAVDDAALIEQVGGRKSLNVMLLARALEGCRLPVGVDDLRRAIPLCVKERFVEMNLRAIDRALAQARGEG